MKTYCFKDRWVLILSTLLLVMFTISGCAGVGPRNISQGRADYNEAINKTEDEQMLLSIVKGRYGETFSLLKVSGVAANFSFGTSAGIDVGFGPSANYAGNLVPFSGGLTYEENPTITYAPVQGEMYIRQLLTPISLDFLLLIVRTGAYATSPLIVLVKRINDMKNPDFLDVPSAEPDPRFYRFVELNRKLISADVVNWVADPRKEVAFDILITGYAPTYSEQVREYLTLLGLPMSKEESEDIVFPVYFAVKSRGLDGIAISTRSTGDLIQILRAAIEVPQEHNIAGVTIEYPEMGLIGKNLRIHSSKDKPEGAAVAVRYRDYWFYINDTDIRTKVFYQMLRILWSVSIAASTDASAAPVFTIPVSR
jgi:hypothetical protein